LLLVQGGDDEVCQSGAVRRAQAVAVGGHGSAAVIDDKTQFLCGAFACLKIAESGHAGVTADVAGTLAKTLPDGVPNEFFDGIKKFISDETARIRAEALKQQPNLTTGVPLQAQNVDDAEDAKMRKWFGI
jgi:hypothetical protein